MEIGSIRNQARRRFAFSLLGVGIAVGVSPGADLVLPSLTADLACFYDFEHPVEGDPDRERDLGFSGTPIELINGGDRMRVADPAHAGSRGSLQTRQVAPATAGNDDWKAGVYQSQGVASLEVFGSLRGITLMGWVRPTGSNPNPDSNSPEPDDYYNAVGLFGLLSGNSEGHGVRALVEVIEVSGVPRLVALGRRVDGGNSRVLAAKDDWRTLLPSREWTHLAASFDFDGGAMALYRNGLPVDAELTREGDLWSIEGPPEPDLSSPTAPAGIKIGGSFPQNNLERNPFNGRFDDLMFFRRALSAEEVLAQFRNFPTAPPRLSIEGGGGTVTLSWPAWATGYALERSGLRATDGWSEVGEAPAEQDGEFLLTLPAAGGAAFFRLNRD